MNASDSPLLPHGGYEHLRSHKVAEAVYGATVVFCDRFIDELIKDYKSFLIQRGLRVWHKDAPEALAMRERLKHDVCPELPPAGNGAVRLTGLAGLATFVAKAEPELAANAMLCATNQAAYLLRRQVESQGRAFLKTGGFTENLCAARKKARAAQEVQQSDQSDLSDPSDSQPAPACPRCSAPMRLRHARQGPRTGSRFWGCANYPECDGLREVVPDQPSS